MHSSDSPTLGSNSMTMPLARIEAQDTLFIVPMREYLESNGCRVLINQKGNGPFEYIICVGDSDFVKSFFESLSDTSSKKLAVLYEGDEADFSGRQKPGIKYLFIDPKPLTKEITKDIFTFFFTGRASINDHRKEPRSEKKKRAMPKEVSREPNAGRSAQHLNDAHRIAQTMRQVYDQHHRSRTGSLPKPAFGIFGKLLFAILLCLVIPGVLYSSSLFVGGSLLVLGGKFITDGDVRFIPSLTTYSRSYINTSRTILSLGSPVISFAGFADVVRDQDRMLTVLMDVSNIESGVAEIFITTRKVAGSILYPDDSSTNVGLGDIIKLTTEVSRVSQQMALASAQVDALVSDGRFPFNSSGVSSLIRRGTDELTRLRNVVEYTEKLLTIYPRIGGFRRKQTFLILLQNSMELRPTGGFIGSLILATFSDGLVEDLEVQDVYTADGQLKGHVDPPLPIREILGSEHWYLRDSNWNPDFSESGKAAAWFYEKELGIIPDGVIAVSLPMVTRLLKVTGPIELLDFNERISESNFFAKSLLYTETDFFPGSTQKKDFLGALMTALLTRVTTDKSLSSGALLQSLTESLRSKDIQFYFPQEELEHLMKQWGWAGGVDLDPCLSFGNEHSCIGDGIGIVGANVGVNKVNFFVSQEALSQIHFTPDGSIEHTTTLNIRNSAVGQTGGGGAYQLYMRLLVPSDAELLKVSLDGVPVPGRVMSNVVPPPAPYSIVESGQSGVIVHVPILVPPKETRQLVLSWIRRQSAVFDSTSEYQLLLRKQPGVERTPWNVVITYPDTWGVIHDGGIAKPGSFEYTTDLTKDEKVKIIFQK